MLSLLRSLSLPRRWVNERNILVLLEALLESEFEPSGWSDVVRPPTDGILGTSVREELPRLRPLKKIELLELLLRFWGARSA